MTRVKIRHYPIERRLGCSGAWCECDWLRFYDKARAMSTLLQAAIVNAAAAVFMHRRPFRQSVKIQCDFVTGETRSVDFTVTR